MLMKEKISDMRDDDLGGDENVSLFDGLWHMILFLVVMLVSLLLLIKLAQKVDEKKVDLLGEYLVTVRWPDDSADDVDTYVRDPNGETVYYQSRERGLMNLDKDDRGKLTDTVMDQFGEEKKTDQNEETVNIRGIIEGEYIVNVHMWGKNDSSICPVSMTLTHLRGKDRVGKSAEVFL